MGSGWWIAELLHSQPELLVAWIFWVIFSICLHELAHGWTAIRLGDRTPIETGHMTWNPLVHMGWMSLVMFAVAGIAWGAMPVNPSRMRGKYAEAQVAVAGPLTNLGLAIISMVGGGLWLRFGGGVVGDEWYGYVMTFFFAGAFLNLILAVFNLAPVPPLDGSKILAEFSSGYRQMLHNPQFQMVGILVFMGLFFYAGDVIQRPAAKIAHWGIREVAGMFGGIGGP